MKRWGISLLVLTVLLVAWEGMVRLRDWPPSLVPSPVGMGNYLVRSIETGDLPAAGLVTVKRLLLGYAAGLIFGLPLGLLTARFKLFQETIGLLALGLQTLPSICWAPLAILWFGQSEAAMFFIVIMGSLWSILLATESGVRNVPPIYVRAANTMGSHGMHTWSMVILPASMPFVVSGMKQGWAFAWRSLMAAEIYVSVMTGIGLGRLLDFARDFHNMNDVAVIIVVIIIIGLLADKVLFSPMERYLHRCWGTGR